MIIDARTLPPRMTVEVDLCVVGGGPAGISVALPFLGDSTTSVAVLESGGLSFDEEAQDLANGESSGHTYFPMKEARIRAFGGSTMSWGGISAPLDTIDFAERSWVPNSGWPMSRTDLDPYYKEAKSVSKVLDPDGMGVGEGYFGDEHGPTPSTRWAEIYFSKPTRFGQEYAQTFTDAKNITTYLYSTVTDIDMNDDQTAVAGLHVASPNGSSFRIVAKRYVLAGGGIENARMLLASGNRDQGGIANGNDLVGRYFQEHPRLVDRYLLPEDSANLASRVSGAAGTLNFSRLGLSDAVQTEEHLLNYIVNVSFGYAGQLTDQFQAVRRIVNASRKPWSDSPYFQDGEGGPNTVRWQDIKTALKKPHRSFQSALGAALEPDRMRQWIHIESNVEQVADPENRVVLSSELDIYGVPKAHLKWRLDAEEERTYRRGLELVVQAFDQYSPGLADSRLEYDDPWPDDVQGCWHHIGTTRMHEDPAHGVVDADCKVHGVANLFVAGSSVFPTGGATSPTLTIVALGLRLAEHLKTRVA